MYHLFRILLILTISILFSACRDTPAVLTKAEQLMETAPDSALQLLKTTRLENFYLPSDKALYALLYCQALDKNGVYSATDSIISIATNYYDDNEPEKAAKAWLYRARIALNNDESELNSRALLMAQNYAEITNNKKIIAFIYSDKAQIYRNQVSYDSAAICYQKSYQLFESIYEQRNFIINKINCAYMYIMKGEIKKAEQLCLEVYENKGWERDELRAYLFKTLGAINFIKKDYRKSILFYKNVTLNSFDNNLKYLLAKTYCENNELDSAILYLNSVNEIGDMAPDYYLTYKLIYKKKGNLDLALDASEMAYSSQDSIYKNRINQSFAGLEKKYNYQKFQLSNRDLKLKNSYKSILLLVILLILSGSIIGFLFLRNSSKHKQLIIEKELSKQETLRAEKEHENGLLLEKQLKLQKIVVTNLEQYRKNALKQPERIKSGFSPLGNTDFNEELFVAIDLEFNNITKRLPLKFKTLSSTDIFICCLLLANFDTGMISSILGIKTASMNIKRSRLRHKLQIDNSINLLEYLRSF
jgi:hypothetical protein